MDCDLCWFQKSTDLCNLTSPTSPSLPRKHSLSNILPTTSSSTPPPSSQSQSSKPPGFWTHKLEITFGVFRVTTSALNNIFREIGANPRTPFWQAWFTLGALFGTVSLVASILVVAYGCWSILVKVIVVVFAGGGRGGTGGAGGISVVVDRPDGVTAVATWIKTSLSVGVGVGSGSSSSSGVDGSGANEFGVDPWDASAVEFRSNSTYVYSTISALEQAASGGSGLLVSLIPGVNLPLHTLGYYFIALAIAGVVHEFGHAIAAAAERVPVQLAGFFVFVIYPGAFVELNEATLSILSPFRRLRIVCAGVWHNAIMAALAWLALLSLPRWLSWGYRDLTRSGWGGVVVLDTLEHSPLHDHIRAGSVITRINDVNIDHGVNGWEHALYVTLRNESIMTQGYCIHERQLSNCCQVSLESPLGDGSSDLQCFLPSTVVYDRPSLALDSRSLDKSYKACMKLQDIVRGANLCKLDTDCQTSGNVEAENEVSSSSKNSNSNSGAVNRKLSRKSPWHSIPRIVFRRGVEPIVDSDVMGLGLEVDNVSVGEAVARSKNGDGDEVTNKEKLQSLSTVPQDDDGTSVTEQSSVIESAKSSLDVVDSPEKALIPIPPLSSPTPTPPPQSPPPSSPLSHHNPYRCMSAYVPHPYIRVVKIHVMDRDAAAVAMVSGNGRKVMQGGGDGAAARGGKKGKRFNFGGGNGSGDGRVKRSVGVGGKQDGGTGMGVMHDGKGRKWKLPERTVLYLGDPREVWEAIRVGSIIPKLRIFPLSLPYHFERILLFLVSFNMALAVLNMVPAPYLDGEYALTVLGELIISQLDASGSFGMAGSGSASIKMARLKKNLNVSLVWIGRVTAVMLGFVMVAGVMNAFWASGSSLSFGG
ncbi:Membrane-bound transcription factor site-2 protease [Blyttiomyces sp. JEL0837]|nr:Membrane-bound transcription factor site-2 protease [Blyttiomyces sp. JEL0837]